MPKTIESLKLNTMEKPTFRELFAPKLITVLREGYNFEDFKADALAGLTVAIVALPLSMAIAIACGLSPDSGLYTAIVAGFIISAFGGSRFQIGGPAGAFIVLIATIIETSGYDGLVMATLIAGCIILCIGFLQLGNYIKYIPLPVVVGFTTGIACIILASQFKELLGLSITKEPAAFVPKLEAIWNALGSVHPATVALSAAVIAGILVFRKFRPTWPAFLIVIVVAAALTAAFNIDVATVGSRFGAVPNSLPTPSLPVFSMEAIMNAIPDAFAIALLGSIESLLSAVVADGMTGRRHRSNCELVAQGMANIGSIVFGGMPATGTIARTATNVRAGARGPVSGMLHALYILLFMLVAAPLAAYIPLAALAGVLTVVAWNMAEKDEFIAVIKASRGDAIVLLATFLLTLFEDLTVGIAAGVTLGAFMFLHRMTEMVRIEGGSEIAADDQADAVSGARIPYSGAPAKDHDLVVFKISGAFFFGSASTVIATLDQMGQLPKVFIFDFTEVHLIDFTAIREFEKFSHKVLKNRTQICIAGALPQLREALFAANLKPPEIYFTASVAEAKRKYEANKSETGVRSNFLSGIYQVKA